MKRWTAEAAQRVALSAALKKPVGKVVIYIEEMDCLHMATFFTLLYGKDIAVLNFANAEYPGVGVKRGAGAQDENIFCRTDCWASIRSSELSSDKRKHTLAMTTLIDGQAGRVYIDMQRKRVCTRERTTKYQISGTSISRRMRCFPSSKCELPQSIWKETT